MQTEQKILKYDAIMTLQQKSQSISARSGLSGLDSGTLVTHLLSLPFHCLKRSVSVTMGSSENQSSLERGGLM